MCILLLSFKLHDICQYKSEFYEHFVHNLNKKHFVHNLNNFYHLKLHNIFQHRGKLYENFIHKLIKF